jgi:peptidoglycan/xylan/chitin deacetylase (PgdA/CDA1 family)
LSSIRAAVKSVCESVLLKTAKRVRAGDGLILAYHNVVPAGTAQIGDRSLHLWDTSFEAQLDVLMSEHRVVPLMELLNSTSSGETRVAITFDDAYASALELGVAACVRRGLPCTVFVSPGLLTSTPAWDILAESGKWSELERATFLDAHKGRATMGKAGGASTSSLLRIADLAALERWSACGLVRLGNHTMNHPNLASLTPVEIQEELGSASDWLRARFSDSVDPVVAYPYGLVPREPHGHLGRCGASFGLAVHGGWIRSGRPLSAESVPRWNVPASITLDGFRLRLRGLFAE